MSLGQAEECLLLFSVLGILEFRCSLFVGINKKTNHKMKSIKSICHRIIRGNKCHCENFKILMRDKILQHFLLSSKCLSDLLCRAELCKPYLISSCALLYNLQFY